MQLFKIIIPKLTWNLKFNFNFFFIKLNLDVLFVVMFYFDTNVKQLKNETKQKIKLKIYGILFWLIKNWCSKQRIKIKVPKFDLGQFIRFIAVAMSLANNIRIYIYGELICSSPSTSRAILVRPPKTQKRFHNIHTITLKCIHTIAPRSSRISKMKSLWMGSATET